LQTSFEKYWNFKFHENPSSGSRVVPCGRTDGPTDATKLIVAFGNFVNAHKNDVVNYVVRLEQTPSVLKRLSVAVSVWRSSGEKLAAQKICWWQIVLKIFIARHPEVSLRVPKRPSATPPESSKTNDDPSVSLTKNCGKKKQNLRYSRNVSVCFAECIHNSQYILSEIKTRNNAYLEISIIFNNIIWNLRDRTLSKASGRRLLNSQSQVPSPPVHMIVTVYKLALGEVSLTYFFPSMSLSSH